MKKRAHKKAGRRPKVRKVKKFSRRIVKRKRVHKITKKKRAYKRVSHRKVKLPRKLRKHAKRKLVRKHAKKHPRRLKPAKHARPSKPAKHSKYAKRSKRSKHSKHTKHAKPPKHVKHHKAHVAEETYDPWKVLLYPHLAEKSMNMVEFQNKLTFVVDRHASKRQIAEAVEKGFDVHVQKVNVESTMKGRKKAYITLSKKSSAADIATRLGMI